jgi:hypothetical protein
MLGCNGRDCLLDHWEQQQEPEWLSLLCVWHFSFTFQERQALGTLVTSVCYHLQLNLGNRGDAFLSFSLNQWWKG